MAEFAIINIIVSIIAILWLTMYMHKYVEDTVNWYNEIGRELFALSIVPVINAFTLTIIVIRYWQAANGVLNPRYN